jgi:hypothetical protein
MLPASPVSDGDNCAAVQEFVREVGASRTTDVQRLVQLLTSAPLNRLELLEAGGPWMQASHVLACK